METGVRIRELRNSKGMTQQQLADHLGIKSYTTITKWEKGDNAPQGKDLIKLSKLFNVSVDDLLGINAPKTNQHEYTYFPTAISAGLPMEVDGITESSKITLADELLGKYSNDQSLFFARASGDSMNKRFKDDALIGIKPLTIQQLNNGDIVVYSDGYDYSVKQYYRYGDTLVFKPNSTNPVHKEHVYNVNDNIMIHGKVVVSVNTYD